MNVHRLPETQAASTLVNVDARTIERHPRSTIVPASHRTPSATIARVRRELELLDTIGEGGMGVVRRGTQRALGREVAVKGLKEDHKDEHSASKLIREARVTGRLEHPNIIPVYDIAEEDGDGAPLIVLKKVEGLDWSALMHDPDAVTRLFGVEDTMEWNLRVFMQVCNAVGFAHSRRVLHRDVKPENVMIGKYGEVYLVDWGIAVSLDGGPDDLPSASASVEMAGTPVYMAPEMLGGGEVSRLSERSDVYLLGAVLYEIVTGGPPHVGGNAMAIVHSILESSPPFPTSVPTELQRILRRALDPDPDARFEQAAQLRLAIDGFLRHRSATQLARRAQERLSELKAGIRGGSDHDSLYRLYGECRFGLRHALEAWADNDEARRALEEATTAMVEFELGKGDPQSARLLLRDLDDVPAELEARVMEAQVEVDREYDVLRRLREDLDLRRARGIRQIALIALGMVWVFWPLVIELIRTHRPEWVQRSASAWGSIITLVVVLLVVGWNRRALLATAINRRLGFAVGLTVIVQLVWGIVAYAMGTSLLHGLQERLLSAAAIVAMLAATVHWGLLVSAAAYMAGYLLTAWIGVEKVLYVSSATNAVLFLNLIVLLTWATRQRRS